MDEHDESVKIEARQFMTDMLGSGGGGGGGATPVDDDDAASSGKKANMSAWRATYAASMMMKKKKPNPNPNDTAAAETAAGDDADGDADAAQKMMMEDFWSNYYDPTATSLWKMVYDEADSNETLEDTIAITTAFMEQTESIKDHCFGVMHTLESLEVEGIWFFNGPDPEELFGTNPDTSWFTWSQLGPDPNDHVKTAVASILTPTDGKLHGKIIQDTQAFGCC